MPDFDPFSYRKGLQGEKAAEDYLCAKGMSFISRRYHSPYGEIDLIMLDDEILVFVEVKARTRRSLQDTQATITLSKQRKIIQTARCFLNEYPEHAERLMRFDIVALADDCIQHLPNAFQGSLW